MNHEATTQLWEQESAERALPRLTGDTEADVCIVGAGISGLTTAYMLLQRGLSVVVLEKENHIGAGQTGRTSAHLSWALDDRITQLLKWHGKRKTALALESHRLAIELIEQIVKRENIDCQFETVPGFLFLSPDDSIDSLNTELSACREAKAFDVELLSSAADTHHQFATWGPCLKFPSQAQFHPLKYLSGLKNGILKRGGHIYGDAHVDTIESQSSKSALVVVKSGNKIKCASVVVATNTPINDRVVVHTKQSAYRSYVLGFAVPRNVFIPALLWDTSEPYHYVRLQTGAELESGSFHPSFGKDILIVGGEDHRTGQEEDEELRFTALEKWARAKFPWVEELKSKWSGQVMEPVDGLAFIGRNPADAKNIYIVTGDSGHGLTHGTIAGMLLPDLIQEKENALSEIYSPRRKPVRSLGRYIKEGAAALAPYKEWLTAGDLEFDQEIDFGTGAVIREGLNKVAVYRDDSGRFHRSSAVCPHLAGIVKWNNAEKTWDCPCHGSRFSATGEMICGPANKDLAKVDSVESDTIELPLEAEVA